VKLAIPEALLYVVDGIQEAGEEKASFEESQMDENVTTTEARWALVLKFPLRDCNLSRVLVGLELVLVLVLECRERMNSMLKSDTRHSSMEFLEHEHQGVQEL
jgi:hypothetical protein